MNPLTSRGSGSHSQRAGTALSVNVNKVALLRNTRSLGIPSVVRAATLCLEAGADGITVHPRPDERHIRAHDVFDLAELLKAWPGAEFNIEGNPFHNLVDLAREVVARGLPLHQCTFVPDSVEQSTSDHGWRFPEDAARLAPLIADVKALGVRVSLFMDPTPEAMPAVRAVGADRVELYTETYARAHAEGRLAEVTPAFADTARAALREGLGVNAGHDLNLDNLTDFLKAVPGVQEVSIGHALVGDALEFGMAETVRRYLQCTREGNT
ncbi:pyridoxine 5'-phosphate synthase [Piscinibacter gummiphilus]|uniref:Pyridoxine 5'-phosphate synthase n=1 Tax=Piscinibacter gummiphilus TaxID=946333 RepID=A0A1W6LEB2_9BURK|nr:pyridoxine 5'-phosphate synthase [Piscinibacter gummiphilus]ARN22604.1 pyridoxine 5'-phosphate synthase [Piscinibacter gummiphilus]ATU67303.1 pyridoxine 5'-phosphate synthase [Piscinibacter gummiphilus]GLS97643.1 pyridoxine 5'-phosphate synthase [Piscinibacter gummiphilus]